MDTFTQFAINLEKLGFSFWQVIVLVLIFLLKNEIRQVAERVSNIKLAGSEIGFEPRDTHVDDLVALQAELSSEEVGVDQIQQDIAVRLKKRTIGALIDIKNNTSFLWDKAFRKNTGSADADIRRSTFLSVTHSLDLLEELGHINYDKRRAYTINTGDLVYSVTVNLKSDEINELIAEANQY